MFLTVNSDYFLKQHYPVYLSMVKFGVRGLPVIVDSHPNSAYVRKLEENTMRKIKWSQATSRVNMEIQCNVSEAFSASIIRERSEGI
jgi:hypothetical protein